MLELPVCPPKSPVIHRRYLFVQGRRDCA